MKSPIKNMNGKRGRRNQHLGPLSLPLNNSKTDQTLKSNGTALSLFLSGQKQLYRQNRNVGRQSYYFTFCKLLLLEPNFWDSPVHQQKYFTLLNKLSMSSRDKLEKYRTFLGTQISLCS